MLLGVPIGALLVLGALVLREPSAARSQLLLADALPGTLLGYVLALPFVLLYALPLLWLALRARLAGPAVAFVAAAAPGAALWWIEPVSSPVAWLPLAIAAAIGSVFVALAYRRKTPRAGHGKAEASR